MDDSVENKKTPKASKAKIELESHKARFMAAFRAEKKWREQKAQDQKFYDGDQLSQEEKSALKERGQPEVVINRVKPKIDGITGIQLQTKAVMKAYDRGTGDFEKAKFISEALRYIDYQNQFEDEEAEAFEESIIQGRSWYKHEVTYEGLEVEFKDYHVPNDDVFLDPYCKRSDLSDAKDLFETVWMDLEDAKELFPGYDKELDDSVNEKSSFTNALDGTIKEKKPDHYDSEGGDDTVWFDRKRKRVRIVTRYYRTPNRKEFALHEDIGLTDITEYSKKQREDLKKTLPDVTFITQLAYKLNSAVFCSVCILEKKEDLRPWDDEAKFPLVMVPAFTTRDDQRIPYGMVRQMVDPQKEINKRRSKMLHILNTTQVVADEGAVDDPNKARSELAKPDGYVVTKQGFRFEILRQTELAMSQFQLLQESKQEIDEAGVSREVQGQLPASQSGRAIQFREQVTVRPLRKLFKNLRFARKRLNLLRLDDIQHYWKDEKLIRITDDPNAQGVILNQRVVNPETGEEMVQNDVSLGKYDLIIEEAPDTLNLQSEQFDKLFQLAQGGLPIPMDMLLESSSLPNKRAVIERIQQQQQAQMAQMQQMQGMPPGATDGAA
jgi:hypothetical protein